MAAAPHKLSGVLGRSLHVVECGFSRLGQSARLARHAGCPLCSMIVRSVVGRLVYDLGLTYRKVGGRISNSNPLFWISIIPDRDAGHALPG